MLSLFKSLSFFACDRLTQFSLNFPIQGFSQTLDYVSARLSKKCAGGKGRAAAVAPVAPINVAVRD